MASSPSSLSPISSSSTPDSPRPNSSWPSSLTRNASVPEPRDFEIAWICPLPVEVLAARAAFTEEYRYDSDDYKRYHGFDRRVDNNIYYFGRIEGYNVVLCRPQDESGGQINAITAWKNLSNKFESVKYLFLVGVAGGIPQSNDDTDIRLGDVVIGLPSKSHPGVIQVEKGRQVGAGIPEQTTFLNKPHRHLQRWAEHVIEDHQNIESPRRQHFGDVARLIRAKIPESAKLNPGLSWDHPGKDYDVCFEAAYPCQSRTTERRPQDWCPANCRELPKVGRLDTRAEGTQTIHGGLICSTSSLITDASYRDKLAVTIYEERQRSNILCFEMEGYSIAEETQCLQIRGISDYSDSHKTKRWQPYAAIQAVAVARIIVEYLSDSKKTGSRTTTVNLSYTGDQIETQEFTRSPLQRCFTVSCRELESTSTGSRPSIQKRRNSNLERGHARDRLIEKPKEFIKQKFQSSDPELLTIDKGTEIPEYYLLDEAATIPSFIQGHRCEFKVYIRTPNGTETRTRTEERKHGTFEANWVIESVSVSSDIKSKLLTFKIDPNGEFIQFWVPVDGIRLKKKQSEYVFEWSDCESFVKGMSQGKERPYYCYNDEIPNLTLAIAFNNTAVADAFSKLLLEVNLEDSSWQPCADNTFSDINKRELSIYLEKSLEESQAQPNQAIIVGRQNASASSFIKLYRVRDSFKLSAALCDDEILFKISNIQVLDFRTGALSEETKGRYQVRPKNGRPSEQVWSTREDRPIPFEIPKIEKPGIKLKSEDLGNYLASVMSWSANRHTARAFIKSSALSPRKEVLSYCGIHDSSAIHFFCYCIKDEKWLFLEVDRKKPSTYHKDHSITVFIKSSKSTDIIQFNPFSSAEEVDTSVTIIFSNGNDYIAVRNILGESSLEDNATPVSSQT